ncbi:MAG TPA: maleylpyruvate isomerase N-terminal domain-containing protein [Acidimicrobiales bacterium]|nr:maleylpyruvate isomerase N-terminal domain-containing protein [Acidimicrobiales bacterium]
MERTSYLAALRDDAERLLAAAEGALDRPVPTCPGWTVERLVGHVGRVYRWTAGWVATGGSVDLARPPSGSAVIGWTRTGLDEVVDALAEGDPDDEVATWAGPQPSIFWPRRMALETAVHRFDGQGAVGVGEPVATDLAIEGVDEILTVLLPYRGVGDLDGAGVTLHLHATDPDIDGGEWLVSLPAAGGLTVEHVHAKGDVAVRAGASDLLLLLNNRVGPERAEVFGDATLLDRWRASVKL